MGLTNPTKPEITVGIFRTSIQQSVADLRSGKFLSGISVGLIAWLMGMVLQVSFASMIFAGPLGLHIQRGIGAMLAGTLVMTLLFSLASGFRSAICTPQDGPAALMAGISAGIVAGVSAGAGAGASQDAIAFITVMAALMCSTALTGIISIIVGSLKLADFVRFIPYPVVAGFLSGTGWLLSKGSLEVMTGMTIGADTIGTLFTPGILFLWVPGFIFAILLLFLLKRVSNVLVLPLALLAGGALYYLVLALLGIDIERARLLGLAFEPFHAGRLWPVFTLADLRFIRWDLILRALPSMAVIPFVSLLGLLLNSTGIEAAGKQETDMNRELRVNGWANLLAGLTGSHSGYTALSLSILGIKTGANTRFVGLTTATGMALVLLFGGQMLAYFPKAILGGFLMLLGLFFIDDWLVQTCRKIPLADYLIIIAIFIVIGLFGFMHGVLVGLILTVLLFVGRISLVPLCHKPRSGALTRSRQARPLPQRQILAMHGDAIHIFDLEGYIFFGSVSHLIEQIGDLAGKTKDVGAECAVLDFSQVKGFDISAISNFARLLRRFVAGNLHFVFAQVPDRFEALLIKQLDSDTSHKLSIFPNLDTGLAWAEDRLLETMDITFSADSEQGRQARESLLDSVSADLMRELEMREKVETLIVDIESWLLPLHAGSGTTILARGSVAKGMHLVKRGSVGEVSDDDQSGGIRTANLSPGETFAEGATSEPWVSPCTYVANSEAELRILTPEAFARLEREHPEVALRVQRLVVDRLVNRVAHMPRSEVPS